MLCKSPGTVILFKESVNNLSILKMQPHLNHNVCHKNVHNYVMNIPLTFCSNTFKSTCSLLTAEWLSRYKGLHFLSFAFPFHVVLCIFRHCLFRCTLINSYTFSICITGVLDALCVKDVNNILKKVFKTKTSKSSRLA